jgi:hypothetical protein
MLTMLTQKPAFILGNPARPGIVASAGFPSMTGRLAIYPYLSYGFPYENDSQH